MRALLLVVGMLLVASDARASVEQRAIERVRPIQEDFRLHSVKCTRWKTGGHICELCYRHPKHYLGWARVWCGKSRCDLVIENDDPRMRGATFGEKCFAK